MRVPGMEGLRKGGIQERRDSEKEGCIIGGMQNRRVAGKER